MRNLLLALWIAPQVWAGPIASSGVVTYEQIRSGTIQFPAPVCPTVNGRYEELNEKLNILKNSIRKETNCADEQIKVDGFAKLVDESRRPFLELIKKGETAALSKEETDKITAYVDQVVKAGGTLADLITGSHCFSDDKKNVLSTELVASLINESTAAVGALLPVYGPLLTVGGKMTSSLLSSLDKLVRSRKAYDFTDADQRKIFVKMMCSYDGFRFELDEVTRPDDAINDMTEYQAASRDQLRVFIEGCPGCKEIYEEYKAAAQKGEDWPFGPLSGILLKFKDKIAAIDGLYVQPVGTHTLINARALIWTANQLFRLDENISDLGDIERDRLVRLQDTMEEFIFVKQMPEFIAYYQREIKQRRIALIQAMYSQAIALGGLYGMVHTPVAELAEMIFAPRSNVALRNFRSEVDRNNYRKGAQADINRRIADLVSAVQVVEKNCQYVRAANLRYELRMQKVCDQDFRGVLEEVYNDLWQIQQATHKNSAVIKSLFEVPGPALIDLSSKLNIKLQNQFTWQANWIQSVTASLKELTPRGARVLELKSRKP